MKITNENAIKVLQSLKLNNDELEDYTKSNRYTSLDNIIDTLLNMEFESEEEIEKESIQCENSSFEYDNCNNISKFESGKEWLYNNRCRTCQHRLRCKYL